MMKIVAAALAWMLTVSVWAQPHDPVAEAEAMMRAGRYADAFQLLDPLEDKLAGDIRYDYLLARAALETGRPGQASFIYERILAVDPTNARARLEMGGAFLALGEYARAKLEFETVLRLSNLPPGLREQARAYARAAENRLAGRRALFTGYLEYGYGYDSNPRSATSVGSITTANPFVIILDPVLLERSDHYHALGGGAEVNYRLGGAFSVYAGGDARARRYRNLGVADYGQLDGRLGMGYARGPHSGRLGIIAGRYDLDDRNVRESAGMTGEYRHLASSRAQLSFNVLAAAYRYVPEHLRANDFDLFQGSLGWLRAIGSGGVLGVSVLGGVEKATGGRLDGDKPFYGGRLTIQHTITDRTAIFVLVGTQRGQYKEINPIFGVQRVDALHHLVTGLSWNFAGNWSLRPQLAYVENRSNLELFKFDRTDLSVNLRLDF